MQDPILTITRLELHLRPDQPALAREAQRQIVSRLADLLSLSTESISSSLLRAKDTRLPVELPTEHVPSLEAAIVAGALKELGVEGSTRIYARNGEQVAFFGDAPLPLAHAQLGGVHLVDVELQAADLRGADLRGADLRLANLHRADLSEARLAGAILRIADLREANLRGADLRQADLRGAHLQRASLRVVELEGANLADAHLEGADTRGAVFSQEEGE